MDGSGSRGNRTERDSRQRDKDEFREDPRGEQEVASQQPETQPGAHDDEPDEGASPDEDDRHGRGQVGRDDPGQATGDQANAG